MGEDYHLIFITNLDTDNRAKDIPEHSWDAMIQEKNVKTWELTMTAIRTNFIGTDYVESEIKYTTVEDIGAQGLQNDRIGDKRSKI
eukprot:scaffold10192_cov138-Chaetoceros_neogracile.AAC.2